MRPIVGTVVWFAFHRIWLPASRWVTTTTERVLGL